MQSQLNRPVSGHVFRVERQRGPVWYAKYRLSDGRQVQKKLGLAWTKRGRLSDGYFTKQTAQSRLDAIHLGGQEVFRRGSRVGSSHGTSTQASRLAS